jgi:hypothetical protein
VLQTVKLLLGGDGSQQEAASVNVTNKSGFTALDMSDVVQQMVGEPTNLMVRDLLMRAGALRGSEVEDFDTAHVHHWQISVTVLPPQILWQFLLHEISLLNPLKILENVNRGSEKFTITNSKCFAGCGCTYRNYTLPSHTKSSQWLL